MDGFCVLAKRFAPLFNEASYNAKENLTQECFSCDTQIMLKDVLLFSGLVFIAGTVLADTKERDEQDAISLSLATRKPHSSPGFIIDPRSGAVRTNTPRAKFMQNMKAAIGSRWANYVSQPEPTLTAQTTRVGFSVQKDGAITNVKILDVDTSSEEFRKLCIKAVKETKLPAFPNDLLKETTAPIEMTFRFTVYDMK